MNLHEPDLRTAIPDPTRASSVGPAIGRSATAKRLVVELAFIWIVGVLIVALFVGGHFDRGVTSRYAIAGILGFWLVCGEGVLWRRLLVVVLVTFLLGMMPMAPGFALVVVLALLAVLTAGWVYLEAAVLSWLAGQVREGQRFTLGHLLLVTALCGLLAVGVQQAIPWARAPGAAMELLKSGFQMGLLGLGLSLVCLPLLTSGWRMLFRAGYAVVIGFFLIPLVQFAFLLLIGETPGAFVGFLYLWIVCLLLTAAIVYPLEFALRELGLSLIGHKWRAAPK